MTGCMPSQLSDPALLRKLSDVAARDRATTAEPLALIAEVDARGLYRDQGCESMHAYCRRELRMSEDVASKRICAARAARKFPSILPAVADGRLHVSAIVQLSPCLEKPVAAALLAEAEGRTRLQLEDLIARRFPRPDLPTLVRLPEVPAAPAHAAEPCAPLAPRPAENPAKAAPPAPTISNVAGLSCVSAPGRIAPSGARQAPVSMPPESPRSRVTPLSPQRYGYQFTLGQAAHEKLGYARALLGHAVPAGDLPSIIERALDALIEKLERTRLGKRSRTRPAPRRSRTSGDLEPNERHVPDRVKNAVWERDGGQCTFVGGNGRRCEAKTRLEFDHIQPVARGGLSTAQNLRLRCRAHNQLKAERTYGEHFMRGRREQRRRGVTDAREATKPFESAQ